MSKIKKAQQLRESENVDKISIRYHAPASFTEILSFAKVNAILQDLMQIGANVFYDKGAVRCGERVKLYSFSK